MINGLKNSKRCLVSEADSDRAHEWFVGDRCTIADHALYPYTRLADESGFDITNYPAVERWLSQVEKQPNFLPIRVEGSENVLSFAKYFQKST